MSFNWTFYVDLSEELLSRHRTQSLKEAYFRTAMSRAYYGVYGIACNFLVKQGITLPPIDKHKFVRVHYSSSTDNVERKIGVNLNRLWRRRIDADYNATARIDKQKAQTSLEFAKKSLTNLQSIGAM